VRLRPAGFGDQEPRAAALGAGLPVSEVRGSMVVDIGGGTTEVAVLAMGGVVVSRSLRVAGDELDQDIIQYIRNKYNLFIGERMAENIKIGIGLAYVGEGAKPAGAAKKEKLIKREFKMRGRNLVTGLPEEIVISENEIRKAIEKSVRQIVNEINCAVWTN